MGDLPEEVVEAHGGLKRRREGQVVVEAPLVSIDLSEITFA